MEVAVSEAAERRGWTAFEPIMLETGLDLLTENGCEMAWKYLQEAQPTVVVVVILPGEAVHKLKSEQDLHRTYMLSFVRAVVMSKVPCGGR